MERGGIYVDAKKIKPLVIEKVIVKAKKTKEREQGGDQKINNTNNE